GEAAAKLMACENTLEIIINAQRAGFSLEEIRRFLPDNNQAGWNHDEILTSLQRKVAEIDVMQERLAQNKARLLEIIGNIENRPEGMGCDGNAERVLAQMREGRCGEAEEPANKQNH
ncbi:MAG: MerR family DNA-binding protein, partial [Pseudomonas sp.]